MERRRGGEMERRRGGEEEGRRGGEMERRSPEEGRTEVETGEEGYGQEEGQRPGGENNVRLGPACVPSSEVI
eukprot:764578-Hanusia_phi.AAC.1